MECDVRGACMEFYESEIIELKEFKSYIKIAKEQGVKKHIIFLTKE